jgi:hypothetical protein
VTVSKSYPYKHVSMKERARLGVETGDAIPVSALKKPQREMLKEGLADPKFKAKPPFDASRRKGVNVDAVRRGHAKRRAAWVESAYAEDVARAAKKAATPVKGLPKGGTPLNHMVKAGLVGGASVAAWKLRNKGIEKADRSDALAGVAGAGIADTALMATQHTAKTAIERHRKANWTPEHQKTWDKYRGKNMQTSGKMSDAAKLKFYGNYPTSLPGGQAQRMLQRISSPKFNVATAAVGAGGAVALHRHLKSKEKVKKADSRKRDAAAAVVGGAAGQSLYQAAGYGPKHYALNNLEPKVTRSQRDKKLKPVKEAFGAYTPDMERNYPKDLPEWKIHRTLGHTHRGKWGMALGTAATLGGAAAGVAAAGSRKQVKKRMSDAELSRRKRRQAAFSTTTATLGLSALSTKGGAAALARGAKAGTQRAKWAATGDKAANWLTTGAAGIGGVGGYNFASVEREESKRRKQPAVGSPIKKGMTMESNAFGIVHKSQEDAPEAPRLGLVPVSKAGPYDSEERRHQRLGAAAGAGTATAGVLGYHGGKAMVEGRKEKGTAMRAKTPKTIKDALARSKALNVKGAKLLGLAAIPAAGAGAAALHSRNRGKTYRAWYDD